VNGAIDDCRGFLSFLEEEIHNVQIFSNQERVVASLFKNQQHLYVIVKVRNMFNYLDSVQRHYKKSKFFVKFYAVKVFIIEPFHNTLQSTVLFSYVSAASILLFPYELRFPADREYKYFCVILILLK